MGERMTSARVLGGRGAGARLLDVGVGGPCRRSGGSTYSHIARLPNPENDAADMAAALRRLGFDVTTAQVVRTAPP